MGIQERGQNDNKESDLLRYPCSKQPCDSDCPTFAAIGRDPRSRIVAAWGETPDPRPPRCDPALPD